jgi:hypothetical protein
MSRRTTSQQERVEMIDLKKQGYSLKQIADHVGVHRDTVRHWWRQYRDRGGAGIQPAPVQRPCRGLLSSFDPLVRYVGLRLKCEHPHWGPEVILLNMRRRPSLKGQALPSRSALAAYLKPYRPRLRGRSRAMVQRPSEKRVRPHAVHEVWQIDFKGDESLGACGKFAPLVVVDSWTSAPLSTELYPAGLKGVTQRDVQASLRGTFAQWGLPDFLQMDRGSIFIGSTRLEWPSTLLLWLVGLGVSPIINDPHCPRQNAQVERQNRTWNDHVAVGARYATRQAAQQATDQARQDRLSYLPSRNPRCAGHPPLVACPDLAHPRRPFAPQHEADLFDFERVELYLADWTWRRTVDTAGYISLADHNLSVGRTYAQQTVHVSYQLSAHAFEVRACDDARTCLGYLTVPVVTPAYILGLGQGADRG